MGGGEDAGCVVAAADCLTHCEGDGAEMAGWKPAPLEWKRRRTSVARCASSDEALSAEGVEDEGFEVGVASDKEVGHLAGEGEGVECGAVVFESLFVGSDEGGGESDLGVGAGFDVGESEVACESSVGFAFGFEFAGAEDLEAEGVVAAGGGEGAQTALVAAWWEEVVVGGA